MSSQQELRLDAEELRKLMDSATRQRVKDMLLIDIRKIETEISLKEEQEKSKGETNTEKTSKPAPTKRIPTVDIKTYAWDQSDKFMKIYATIPDIESVPKEQVTCNFTNRSFQLKSENVKGKNYTCSVSNLMEDIVPEESQFKIKTGKVLVMLKKKDTGKTWAYVTEKEKKAKEKPMKKPDLGENKDPNESLMSMMKQMYEDGDDEMKRTIAKAWTESRDKQAHGDIGI